MQAEFEGMVPWQYNSEIIECDTPHGLIDLHNDCVLEALAVQVGPPPSVVLTLHRPDGDRFQLVFHDVLEASFVQDSDDALPGAHNWDREEVSTVYGVDYTDMGTDALPRFEISLIVGTVALRSPRVSLTWLSR
ncbi:hypothetical protein [Planosporangium mesophilum]|nr:hypothetical protein [Planosporangium mesophilum]NJC84154.1 hypothetical protein [Planosporangium mesophilum]